MMNETENVKPKIALIGCGAVTSRSYLPALAEIKNANVQVLVDKNLSRAKKLAEEYGIPYASQSYRTIFDDVQLAIVALPHYLHASVTIDLLKEGIDVLVEKPMALRTEECDQMIQVAEETGTILTIGLVRRFRWSIQLVKTIIQENLIGQIVSFDIQEGDVYNWPVASDFFLRKEKAGGGVLFDTGTHILDTLLWWFGDVSFIEYFDDQFGGIEADCTLLLETESGAKGTIKISRIRTLRNTAIIRGTKATIEVGLNTNRIKLQICNDDLEIIGNSLHINRDFQEQSTIDLFTAQLSEWIEVSKTRLKSIICGTEGRRSVALIEKCYRNRKPMNLPWVL